MSDLNPLDIVLVLLAIAYGVAGFRQGFLVGSLGFLGLIGGGIGGAVLAPVVLNRFESTAQVSLAALAIVIVVALVGQAVGASIGRALRNRVTWRPAHLVDASGGAVLSVVAVLVVAWILGSALAGAHFGSLARVVRTSDVLATVDKFMPPAAERGLQAFARVVDPGLFPRYLEPFAPERIAPAQPPSRTVLADPDVQRAGDSVVRILGVAPSCSRSLEGSGFVYGRERVMTNAHVVAGVSEPEVQTRGGRTYQAEVVLYDPDLDVAVLAVPGLDLRRLRFDTGATNGDQGVVMGYPENGPFWAGPARIRSEQRLRGPDIYGDRNVVRDVFSLHAEVRPGNSGGPLVSTAGTVSGVIFAASVEDSQTGYALTAEEVLADARAGSGANDTVPTGGCA